MRELPMPKPACKHGDIACGNDYWKCGKCKDVARRAAYARQTPAQKRYDNWVDPAQAYHTDYDRYGTGGCSCHINPPCSHCVEAEGEESER